MSTIRAVTQLKKQRARILEKIETIKSSAEEKISLEEKSLVAIDAALNALEERE